jgi:hypothetical protein
MVVVPVKSNASQKALNFIQTQKFILTQRQVIDARLLEPRNKEAYNNHEKLYEILYVRSTKSIVVRNFP